jgi:hypothetical protein
MNLNWLPLQGFQAEAAVEHALEAKGGSKSGGANETLHLKATFLWF